MTTMMIDGRIETFHPAHGAVEAIAFREGVVFAIGTRAEVESAVAAVDGSPRRVQLDGATVWPGLIDTHMHFEKVSHELAMLRLESAGSVADVVEMVRSRAEEARSSRFTPWIRCLADNEAWHEGNLVEGRLPVKAELDPVSADVPVYIYRRPDRAVINSAGRALLADLIAQSPTDFDEESGYVSGPLVRRLNDQIYHLGMADSEYRHSLLASASREILSHGVTSIVDPGIAGGFESAWELFTEAHRRGEIRQRVRLMNRVDWRRPLAEEIRRILDGTSPRAVHAQGELEAWGVKILVDGEFTTAWMRGGEEIPGARAHYSVEEIRSVVELCAERGWPLTAHAMGGGAIAAITEAVAGARNRQHARVKLAHGFLMDVVDMQECERWGIDVTVNPPLSYVYAREMRAAWGPLAGRAMPLRTMELQGMRFAAGSDTHPLAPLHGALMAATRRGWDGSDLGQHEEISPRRAVEMYTRDAGAHIGEEHLGTLVPGAPADAVVWGQDPFETYPRWEQMRPQAVYVRGDLEHEMETTPHA